MISEGVGDPEVEDLEDSPEACRELVRGSLHCILNSICIIIEQIKGPYR